MTEFAPCPKCNNSVAERLKFTWWGGALGPKILTHVKCGACGMKYNGKTGRDNTTGIVVYSIIAGVISFALLFIVVFVFAVLR
jgi:uncharacterized protein (DUF983 family)